MNAMQRFFRRVLDHFNTYAEYKVRTIAQSHAYGDHVREYIMDRDADGKLNLHKWGT